MSVGAFFAFSAGLFMLYTPIKKISKLYNMAQDAVVANCRMQELLNLEAKIISGDRNIDRVERVQFDDVSLEFSGKRVLDGISIDIKRGGEYRFSWR